MSHIDIITLLAQRFEAGWDSVTTPVEWPNTPPLHDKIPYVRFSVVFPNTTNYLIGNLGKQYSGILTIQVFTKTGEGYGEAYDLAKDANDLMENLQFNDIHTFAGKVVEIGKDPDNSDLFNVNAVINFEAFERT